MGILLLLLWLAVTTPLSRSLHPPVPPSLTLVSAEGEPIARSGSIVEPAVAVHDLPPEVWLPFVAIEDRRFLVHPGVDARGLARAAWRNLRAGEVREGGSTITQQLAKTAFLDPSRTVGRKFREMLIALWLELWLSKEDILSRYLSTAYFGNDVYGLRAAARYYFDVEPQALRVEQAAMLAGMVKAPSRLNPTADPEAAAMRMRQVLTAMADIGAIEAERAAALPRPRPIRRGARTVPTGTYFADWIFPQARAQADRAAVNRTVRTTLEADLQRHAVNTVGRAGLGGAQVALVAMRPDGRVVAMVGGRNYRRSPYNRATMARRQPGSTFKLFVYLAAIRAGMSPDSLVDDSPVEIDGWSPANADGRYRGPITLREAVRLSSNAASVRLAEQVGRNEVIRAARDLGLASPLDEGPAATLGTSEVSLLEMTAAYAAVAAGRYPVVARGLPEAAATTVGGTLDQQRTWPMLLELLWTSANDGTGRAAALTIPTFGKTGTSQDNRDAWFIGFAGQLVVGVWIGHDDNRSLGDIAGGNLPARIWRDFMRRALPDAGTRTPYHIRMVDEDPTDRRTRPPRRYQSERQAEERRAARERERWQRFFERDRARDRDRDRNWPSR